MDGGQAQVDRIDTSGRDENTEGTKDLDYAMGTLMAYGGKYLRKMAVWAWENSGSWEDSFDSLGSSLVSAVRYTINNFKNQFIIFYNFSGSASKIGSTSSSKKPYLSTLSKNALDKLALKAVKAGADINKLKQGAAVAHKSDNWSLLEKEISDALGEDAIKPSGLFG